MYNGQKRQSKQSCGAGPRSIWMSPEIREGQAALLHHPTSAFTYGVTQCAHIRANEKGHVPAGTGGEDKAHLAPCVPAGEGQGRGAGLQTLPPQLRASQVAPPASGTTLHVVVWAPGLPTGRGVEGILCGGGGGAGLHGSLSSWPGSTMSGDVQPNCVTAERTGSSGTMGGKGSKPTNQPLLILFGNILGAARVLPRMKYPLSSACGTARGTA